MEIVLVAVLSTVGCIIALTDYGFKSQIIPDLEETIIERR